MSNGNTAQDDHIFFFSCFHSKELDFTLVSLKGVLYVCVIDTRSPTMEVENGSIEIPREVSNCSKRLAF